MDKINDGGPVAPIYPANISSGISMRDYIAMTAMNGMCANSDISKATSMAKLTPEECRKSFAESAYKMADEMLKAREPQKDEK